MLEFEAARAIIAIVLTAILAFEDQMTSFMDEKVLYSMIAIGAVLDLATANLGLIEAAALGGLLIFGIGYYYYRKGELGGGDVLLLCGLHLLFPYPPSMLASWVLGDLGITLTPVSAAVVADFNSVVPLVVSVLVTATLLGLIFTAIRYAFKLNWSRPKPDLALGTVGLLAALIVLGSSIFYWGARPLQIIVYSAAFIPAIFLAAFGKQIKAEIIVEQTPISKILDEDVLAVEFMDPAIVKKYSLGTVLTASEVEKLKVVERKEGISKFPISRDLPRFGPFLLAGLLLTLAVGNIILLLMVA